MNLAKGEISVEEILTLYSHIKNYFQKDKNKVCLSLDVLSANILDWFGEYEYGTKVTGWREHYIWTIF